MPPLVPQGGLVALVLLVLVRKQSLLPHFRRRGLERPGLLVNVELRFHLVGTYEATLGLESTRGRVYYVLEKRCATGDPGSAPQAHTGPSRRKESGSPAWARRGHTRPPGPIARTRPYRNGILPAGMPASSQRSLRSLSASRHASSSVTLPLLAQSPRAHVTYLSPRRQLVQRTWFS